MTHKNKSTLVRDLAVVLKFVCGVVSGSAAPQKDRHCLAFSAAACQHESLSSGAERRHQVCVPSDRHATHIVCVQGAREELHL